MTGLLPASQRTSFDGHSRSRLMPHMSSRSHAHCLEAWVLFVGEADELSLRYAGAPPANFEAGRYAPDENQLGIPVAEAIGRLRRIDDHFCLRRFSSLRVQRIVSTFQTVCMA